MNKKITLTFLPLFVISIFSIANVVDEKSAVANPGKPESRPNLVQAVMCEDMKGSVPQYPAIVFSISLGKVFCFTEFDPVPENTFVYHNWYFREQKRASVKLSLNPPRWATYSTVQMQETDKGPWRVEITDHQGNIFRILRFSVTD